MDQNTKRDRDQKMKRDKRSKDVKRSHASKAEVKPTNVKVSKSQSTSTKTQDTTEAVIKPISLAETLENIDLDDTRSSHLKRETDSIIQINKSFSKRQITSNWSKYETPLPPANSDIINRGADFESLLSAPISEGGHFKFKSEKMWASSTAQYGTIFSLDTKRLARGLSCVPFYKQVNLPKECFSVEELELMENEAKQNVVQLKTASNEPLSSNFYNILKSSLTGREVSPSEKIDPLYNPTFENIITLSTESEKVKDTPKVPVIDVLCDNEAASCMSKPRDNKISQLRHGNDADKSQLEQLSPNKNTANSSDVQVGPNDVGNPCEERTANAEKPVLDCKKNQLPNSIEDDELDFLLALKEPISTPKYTDLLPSQPQAMSSKIDLLSMDLGAVSLPNAEEKENLEDWLDSILDED